MMCVMVSVESDLFVASLGVWCCGVSAGDVQCSFSPVPVVSCCDRKATNQSETCLLSHLVAFPLRHTGMVSLRYETFELQDGGLLCYSGLPSRIQF